MTLPAGVALVTNIKGAPGEKGETGTIASAIAQSVPADQPAAARMTGTAENRGLELDIPRGLPGVNAVEADEAYATYVEALDSLTRAALERSFGPVVQVGRPTGDDHALIQAAIDNAPGQTIRLMPGATYVLDEPIVLSGEARSLDLAGATLVTTVAEPAIRVTGDGLSGSPVGLSVTADAGTKHLTLTAAIPGLAAGDYLVLGSDVQVTMPSAQGSAYRGELVQVAAVAGAAIELRAPIYWSYATLNNASVQVVKLSYGHQITSGSIRGNSAIASGGIELKNTTSCVVSGVSISDVGAYGVSVEDSVGTILSTLNISGLPSDPGVTNGYGVVVSGYSAATQVVGGIVRGGRHAFTTAGKASGKGVPMGLSVLGMQSIESIDTSFDTHAPGVGIVFTGCVSTRSNGSGFTLRGERCRVDGGQVIGAAAHGVQFPENGGSGNSVSGLAIVQSGGAGVRISGSQSRPTIRNCEMRDTTGPAVSIEWDAVRPIIVGNLFENCGRSASAVILATASVLRGVIAHNEFIKDVDPAASECISAPTVTSALYVSQNMHIGFTTLTSSATPVATTRTSGNVSADMFAASMSGVDAYAFSGSITVPASGTADLTVRLDQVVEGDTQQYGELVVSGQSSAGRVGAIFPFFRSRSVGGSAFGDITTGTRVLEGDVKVERESGTATLKVALQSINLSGGNPVFRFTNGTTAALKLKVTARYL